MMPMHIDSTSCISFAKNPVITDKSKHIDIVHHFLRERVERGDISISYVSSNANTADVLTKHLKQPALFLKHRNGLGIRDARSPLVSALPAAVSPKSCLRQGAVSGSRAVKKLSWADSSGHALQSEFLYNLD